MPAIADFLQQNSYPIALAVFVASLVYLLVFDEKQTDKKPAEEEKATKKIEHEEKIDSINPRVPSQVEKDQIEDSAEIERKLAEQEEQSFLQDQRNKMKSADLVDPQEPQATPAKTAQSNDPFSPLLAVPNAFIYGVTLGNVNLFASSSSADSKEAEQAN